MTVHRARRREIEMTSATPPPHSCQSGLHSDLKKEQFSTTGAWRVFGSGSLELCSCICDVGRGSLFNMHATALPTVKPNFL